MNRALGAFLIVVFSFVTALALFYGSNMWSTSPFGNFSESQEDKTDQIVKLEVTMSESGEWRDIEADSPSYASTITYNVSNYGSAAANNIEVSIFVDGVTLEEFSLTSLSSNGSFSDQIFVSANHGSSKEVSITASCEDSTDTDSLIIYAILTRTFDKNLAMLYVTPRDPIIKRTLDTIVKNPLIPDWIEIRDWVANKIEYVSDKESYGVSGYWQLPVETLSLGTGDCEDFSVLLCSLYRATGWDENEVYVVVGQKNGALHAWVKLNVDIIGWQNIEPQAGGLSTIIGDYLSFSGYTAKYNFNDAQFKTLSEDVQV